MTSIESYARRRTSWTFGTSDPYYMMCSPEAGTVCWFPSRELTDLRTLPDPSSEVRSAMGEVVANSVLED